jgi:hypothetical protein
MRSVANAARHDGKDDDAVVIMGAMKHIGALAIHPDTV